MRIINDPTIENVIGIRETGPVAFTWTDDTENSIEGVEFEPLILDGYTASAIAKLFDTLNDKNA